MDADEPRKKTTAHEIGSDLSPLSIDELRERVGLLQGEIDRLEREVEAKTGQKAAAAAIFKT
ncbi:DUF1192 domain-containing protein [Tepidamorphus sp. 3E244]|uniref:DUF1192 domain-containing protein n=1 Tax=Tepidamorphus sp. 3E244 TaxID=3385498 RepID=UPI0038FCB6A8